MAFTLRSSSKNCSPAPDLALWKLIFLPIFLSRGVFLFTGTGVSRYLCYLVVAFFSWDPSSLICSDAEGEQMLHLSSQAVEWWENGPEIEGAGPRGRAAPARRAAGRTREGTAAQPAGTAYSLLQHNIVYYIIA